MAKINGFLGDYVGHTNDEVYALHLKYGKNELVKEKKESFFSKILNIFKEPMFLLLFCTAFLYFILGEPKDGAIMLCFVAFMSSISIFQEWRTDKTLNALKDLSAPTVKVVRNGEIQIIDAKELTVSDLYLLEEGEKISADGEILEMYDLGVDESILTGESDVVWKKQEICDDTAFFKRNTCYAGTTVVQGSAIIRVTHIGTNTEYGKIGQNLLSVSQNPTPLEIQIKKVIKISGLISLAFFVMVFAVTFLGCRNLIDSILSGITLAMAMIPEEFPVILTVFLAMGAWRLATKKSLIKKMPSVETLGSVSVLCVDKTGTLTKNQMTVAEVFVLKNSESSNFIEISALACETEPFDPMEKAILSYAVENKINKNDLFSKRLVFEYPFSSETKMMGHIWEFESENILAAKGSPESILPLCNLNENDMELVLNKQEELSQKGYRVIAVAKRNNIIEIKNNLCENELELLGLIGLLDPPREEVYNAISVCKNAGIRVVMITGDNASTAKSIACKIGIANFENVITGYDLEKMSDDELREKIKTTNIFARVIPSHKMRIVRAFKENGEIVAMTGDGVNDAPALKLSDIGIAMGKRGTGVCREASDMILLDDNFTTIVDTISDGRRIYDNIKKAIGYVFVIHIPIALMALIAPIMKLPLILFPIHIVLLELIIDPTCSIIFERQPSEKGIMNKKPRKKDESLVDFKLLQKSLFQGFVIFAASFGAYYHFQNSGFSEEYARTMSVLILGFSNLFLVFVNQSQTELGILKLFNFKDRVVFFVNVGIILALLTITYLPFANTVAKTVPLDLYSFLTTIIIAFVATFWYDAFKTFKRFVKKPIFLDKNTF